MPANNHKDKPTEKDPMKSPEDTTFMSQAVEKTKRLGAYMDEKADQATKAAGAGLHSVGKGIHEAEPEAGVLHNIGEAIAAKCEEGGRYLQNQGLHGIGNDITNLIRRNPIPALLMGIGIGFLIARTMKRS